MLSLETKATYVREQQVDADGFQQECWIPDLCLKQAKMRNGKKGEAMGGCVEAKAALRTIKSRSSSSSCEAIGLLAATAFTLHSNSLSMVLPCRLVVSVVLQLSLA
ncbi:hypothetical protein Tcan_00752, partial [Toxocara canis]